MTTGHDDLEAAFGKASPDHFEWQTQNAFVAARERELVRSAFEPLGKRVLDLGCGEGATLFHLGEPAGAVGVDLFEPKVAFARERLPKCTFQAASVYELPFEANRFDHLLVRDLIHHLDEPERFVDECDRVLAAGGRIDVLEPCRYNPMIVMHALSRREERGELRSTPAFLETLLARRFMIERTTHHQALPIHRIVFHPQLGGPSLAGIPSATAAVRAIERLAERVLPKTCWAYLHVRATKR